MDLQVRSCALVALWLGKMRRRSKLETAQIGGWSRPFVGPLIWVNDHSPLWSRSLGDDDGDGNGDDNGDGNGDGNGDDCDDHMIMMGM
jgi:hypothetical protein